MARPSAELRDPSATSGTLSFVGGQSDETLYVMGDEFLLPPADHGKQAWLFLAAAFVVEALTWGFPFVFGVFHDYYVTHELFAGSSQIPIIGTCALGIMFLDVPLVMGLQRLFPSFGRWSPVIGLPIMSISLAASSFSRKPAHLIVT
ncbi:hypothetical protein HRG_003776 [Hirsutella rhossiliensis]|uniref:Uncharacterized protein n=1 Tax=Hirsutella rhossiliensis TaxID=111463 RepID=A0A9P8N2M7_9HYPO|nr:uncharacterized protein HRG_03776 [Hirsutella rhossiliensis]KAH0965760.1 hypothetical protein HRG_03776 [Hirsutella rhossiliensis]